MPQLGREHAPGHLPHRRLELADEVAQIETGQVGKPSGSPSMPSVRPLSPSALSRSNCSSMALVIAAVTPSDTGSTSRCQVGMVASTHSARLHARPLPFGAGRVVTGSTHRFAT